MQAILSAERQIADLEACCSAQSDHVDALKEALAAAEQQAADAEAQAAEAETAAEAEASRLQVQLEEEKESGLHKDERISDLESEVEQVG